MLDCNIMAQWRNAQLVMVRGGFRTGNWATGEVSTREAQIAELDGEADPRLRLPPLAYGRQVFFRESVVAGELSLVHGVGELCEPEALGRGVVATLARALLPRQSRESYLLGNLDTRSSQGLARALARYLALRFEM